MAKTVKRIKLSGGKRIVDDTPVPKAAEKPSVEKESSGPKMPSTNQVLMILASPYTYVVNSWRELTQVRWPNRRATWGLTVAVIGFTLFFSVIILALDFVFQFVFKEVLFK